MHENNGGRRRRPDGRNPADQQHRQISGRNVRKLFLLTAVAIRLYVWYVYVREIGGVAVGGHQVRTCFGVGLGLCEPS